MTQRNPGETWQEKRGYDAAYPERELCWCEGPWADIPPENRPETVLEREHTLGAIVNDRARCVSAPSEATT